MRQLCWIAGVLMGCSVGCQERPSVVFEEQLTHANGLVISRPAGFVASVRDDGFLLQEAGDLRSPTTVMVSVAAAEPLLTNAELRRLADGVDARFHIRTRGAGSAGTEYELTAVKPHAAGRVVLVAAEQTESGVPRFDIAWAVLARADRASPL